MNAGQVGNVVIKLEVQVPQSGGPPLVFVQSGSGVGQILSIEEPQGRYIHTRASGHICLRGKVETGPQTEVWALVVPGTTVPPIPTDPGAAGATRCEFNPYTGEFRKDLLPGVLSYPAIRDHLVVVWGRLNGQVFQIDSRVFAPIWSGVTECEYPGVRTVSETASLPSCFAFELLPVKWQLVAKTFHGPDVSEFNGTWTVKLQSVPGQKILYCSGGSGAVAPRVQMICESAQVDAWRLQFQLGSATVTFVLPPGEFDPQRPNRFIQPVSTVCGESNSAPLSILVSPV